MTRTRARGSMSRRMIRTLWQIAIFVVAIGSWEITVLLDPSQAFWISRPSLIATRLWQDMLEGAIFLHVGLTLLEAAVGLLGGVVVGVMLGLVLGTYRTVGDILEPYVMALNSIPRIALAPFIVMYFGIGFTPKAVLAFSLVVVVVMLNTIEGIRAVDPAQLNALKVMRASSLDIFRKFLLPNATPYIITSVRISVSLALIGVLVGEFIVSQGGIGYLINESAGAFDITGMLVPLTILIVVAVLLDYGLREAERKLVYWRKPLNL